MPNAKKVPSPALVAFNRFGLGPKPGGHRLVAADARAAVRKELLTPGIATLRATGLKTYAQACAEGQKDFTAADTVFRAELSARLDKHLQVPIGFVERLVMFWSNHFSVSVEKGFAVRGTVGQLERDVIRRHALGRFEDMLLGVMRHPAMLEFLDNDDSIGPNSPAGQWWDAGFNENLAREIMELHTVGSGGGYTEADVTAFARILTGWSFVRDWEVQGGWNGAVEANRGQYIYRPDWHEPGPITVMGKAYANDGEGQAIAVLRDLARHPRTAEHIAFKLVRHFITDLPTRAMVEPVARAFLRSGGDLKAVALALIDLPEAWTAPLAKVRTPYEMLVAQYRAIGSRHDDETYWYYWSFLDALKHFPFAYATPDGYPDETRAWLAPDAMTIRLDTAQLFVWVFNERLRGNAVSLAKKLYGKAIAKPARRVLKGANWREQGFTLLFMLPEFQRR